MKELTIEQKAQRYDEALGRAKEIHAEERAQPFDVMLKVFPELKESEDERIKKWLINYFREVCDNVAEKEKNAVLTWLEKQGEQILANSTKTCKVEQKSWSEEDEKMLNHIIGLLEGLPNLHNWLKSLKDRYTWKPSDEQMKALKEAVDEHFDIDGGALWHLYEQLKKHYL